MLELKNVKKKYKDFSLDVSLSVLDGRITGLIGENGSGKSTTFKAILDLIFVDSGTIVCDCGKEDIGVVLSDSSFSGYLTVNQICRLLKNFYMRFEEAKFVSYCHRFQLPMDKPIRFFSTGMKAKLKLFVALSHQAKFLILDEATAGLDVVARDEILELLREYMEEDANRSILMSSHISSDLESICDDLYMISKGTILLHEDTDVLLSDYGMIKCTNEQYEALDKADVLKVKKEHYGYCCLTKERQYYQENYPSIVVEKSRIDDLILLMIRGE